MDPKYCNHKNTLQIFDSLLQIFGDLQKFLCAKSMSKQNYTSVISEKAELLI